METNDKMREALERIAAIPMPPPIEQAQSVAVEMREVAIAALAAPQRNCNVGTVAEQEDRFEKFCDAHKYVGDDGTNVCSRDCPCYNGMDCGIRWSQMPYEEGGEK
jgi:hypothetical protein